MVLQKLVLCAPGWANRGGGRLSIAHKALQGCEFRLPHVACAVHAARTWSHRRGAVDDHRRAPAFRCFSCKISSAEPRLLARAVQSMSMATCRWLAVQRKHLLSETGGSAYWTCLLIQRPSQTASFACSYLGRALWAFGRTSLSQWGQLYFSGPWPISCG